MGGSGGRGEGLGGPGGRGEGAGTPVTGGGDDLKSDIESCYHTAPVPSNTNLFIPLKQSRKTLRQTKQMERNTWRFETLSGLDMIVVVF